MIQMVSRILTAQSSPLARNFSAGGKPGRVKHNNLLPMVSVGLSHVERMRTRSYCLRVCLQLWFIGILGFAVRVSCKPFGEGYALVSPFFC